MRPVAATIGGGLIALAVTGFVMTERALVARPPPPKFKELTPAMLQAAMPSNDVPRVIRFDMASKPRPISDLLRAPPVGQEWQIQPVLVLSPNGPAAPARPYHGTATSK